MSKILLVAGIINRVLKAVFFIMKESEHEKTSNQKKGK